MRKLPNFVELYNEAALHIDELAERLLAIGGKPVATMKGILNLSSVKEAEGSDSAVQMVQSIASDFSVIVSELKEGMAVTEELNDEVTGDILLAIHSALEKHVWMLNAFTGK